MVVSLPDKPQRLDQNLNQESNLYTFIYEKWPYILTGIVLAACLGWKEYKKKRREAIITIRRHIAACCQPDGCEDALERFDESWRYVRLFGISSQELGFQTHEDFHAVMVSGLEKFIHSIRRFELLNLKTDLTLIKALRKHLEEKQKNLRERMAEPCRPQPQPVSLV